MSSATTAELFLFIPTMQFNVELHNSHVVKIHLHHKTYPISATDV